MPHRDRNSDPNSKSLHTVHFSVGSGALSLFCRPTVLRLKFNALSLIDFVLPLGVSGKDCSASLVVRMFLWYFHALSAGYSVSGIPQPFVGFKNFSLSIYYFWEISCSRTPNMKLVASGLARNSKIKSREINVFFTFFSFFTFFLDRRRK